ncbi:MAG: magnesium transporter [Alistipes sp.]
MREFLGLILGAIWGSSDSDRDFHLAGAGLYDYGTHWPWIAASVSVSLVFIVLWGTLSGSMIPFILKKCGLDPATASAPFVATLVDVTGLIIYFSIAALFLTGKIL